MTAGRPALVQALLDPAVYRTPGPVELRETHISWVFLVGARAYKLKKPLRLPFLDYGTPERRAEMCAEEVRLNRRLAPPVYLGVRSVLRTDGGVALGDAGDPAAVDHVVEMRRFDEGGTLAAALAAGRAMRLAELAALLARFHEDAELHRPSDPVGAWRATLEENHDTLGRLAPDLAGALTAHARFDRAWLEGHGEGLVDRAARGRVRDGHGDLRADHVLLEERLAVVDCLEFDPRLRIADVGADLATLVADLTARDAPSAAAELVRAYRVAGGDPGTDAQLAFWSAHRALVAAKVAGLRGGAEAPAAMQRLVELAHRFAWRARAPLLVVVCGLPASGKSRLAEALARAGDLPLLGSDRVRKELAGVAASERAPAGAYTDAATTRTYAELGRRAGTAVRDGGIAVVDATFHRRAARADFAAALSPSIPAPVYLWCQAPPEVLRRRAEARLAEPDVISDATPAVLAAQRAAAEPFAAGDAVAKVDTDVPPVQTVDGAVAALDAHLARGSTDASRGIGPMADASGSATIAASSPHPHPSPSAHSHRP